MCNCQTNQFEPPITLREIFIINDIYTKQRLQHCLKGEHDVLMILWKCNVCIDHQPSEQFKLFNLKCTVKLQNVFETE